MESEETITIESADEINRSKRIELIRKIKAGDFILSHSSFNEFCQSPKHFIDYKLQDKVETDAMRFGTMVHCSILEPEKFDELYYPMPEFDGRTKEGKAIKEQCLIEANGKQLVTGKDFKAAKRIGESIRRNDPASDILSKCVAFEVGIEWEYKGIKWRGKMDGDGRPNGIILDLKILADVSPRSVFNYVKYEGAGRQAAHYLKSAPPDCEYYVLAADRMGNCSVSKIGKGVIAQISREIDWYISRFKSCIFTGQWGASYDFYSPTGFFEINSL